MLSNLIRFEIISNVTPLKIRLTNTVYINTNNKSTHNSNIIEKNNIYT